jgi:DNA replicative helicase MCM subunit Mcm2 (Cdc46/Mcm family)
VLHIPQGVPIAVRHVESLIRMSEASARMHLREYVNDADVNLAIRTCLESFVSTQKYAVQRTLQRKFKGYLTYQKDFNALALDVLRSHVREALHYNRMVRLLTRRQQSLGTPAALGRTIIKERHRRGKTESSGGHQTNAQTGAPIRVATCEKSVNQQHIRA